MKKTAFLLPLLLSACFPVVFPVTNPLDDQPNIYGAWRLAEINHRAPSDTNAVFILNSSDSGFTAVSECHQVSGEYTSGDKHSLRFGKMQSKNSCGAEIPERNLVQGLENVRFYRFNQRQLELLDDQGKIVVTGKRLRGERSVGRSDSGGKPYLSDARRH